MEGGKHAKKHALTPEMEARKWKPGECPNPSGRPKGSVSLLTRIKRKLRQKVKEGPHAGKRYADLAADAYVKACLQGDFRHMKELLDREDGVPPIPVEHEHEHSHTVDYDQLARDLDSIARGGVPANGNGQPVRPRNADKAAG